MKYFTLIQAQLLYEDVNRMKIWSRQLLCNSSALCWLLTGEKTSCPRHRARLL